MTETTVTADASAGPQAEATTSPNEEAQDTDVELEDMGFEPEEPAADETEESDETDDTEAATDESEEVEEESEDDEDEKHVEPNDEVKRRNDENAKRRMADREERERQKQQQQQSYIDEAEDDRDLALRQLQVDAYNNKVQFNSDKLQNGLEKAIASIPEFTNGSPEVKEALISAVDDFEQMYVSKDKNGDPIEVRADIHQFLVNKAESIRKLTGLGARQEAKAKKATKARVDTIPNREVKPKVDKDLAAFDAAWDD